jgi:hypothetical protein
MCFTVRQTLGEAMEADRIWNVVARVYYNAEVALWALLITSVIFLAFQLPRLSAISAAIAATRAAEVAAENAGYCERLGMKAATQPYSDCLLTIGDFRRKVEQRIDAENDF